MADVGFADLVEIYRHTRFDGEGGGVLTIANDHVADTMRAIESDPDLYDLTQISLVDQQDPMKGVEVAINVAAPSLRLGILAADFDSLFLSPDAAFAEPANYFVVDLKYAAGDQPAPEILIRYRALLAVIEVLADAATFVDKSQREMVFIGNETTVVPILFKQIDLPASLMENADRLARLFADPLHRQEKSDLLAAAMIDIASAQRPSKRFQFIIANLDHLCDEVEKGYRLFVSSFSYSKIRKEIEKARLEYTNKIHKTIVDIQGQLLGNPIATIVVATLFKPSRGCGIEFWANLAVLLGAWIFVALLGLAVRNQWHTLRTLAREIEGQRTALENDYAAVSNDFMDLFDDLDDRIGWHRKVLVAVGGLAILGGLSATVTFLMLTETGSARCLVGG